ncbi:MAG: histidine kinase [Alteromonadaceae bacterium]|nr:MAG: histidine kinase [Alteromonadaceae bacterium]
MSDSEDKIDFAMVLASSVHDMKNSVGMLLASLEAVIEEMPPTNARQANLFNTLHYESSRINGELIQLLTIYRMNSDFLPVSIDEHYVVDVLEEQVARNSSLMETGNIELELRCDEDLAWYYDLDLVGSVVHNVLVNCVRYTKSRLILSADIEDEFLHIRIQDNGPGYPDTMLRSPTDLVDKADVNDGDTHLGLYFAECIAKMHKQNEHKGYIKLENGGELGGGVFSLFIP